LVLLLQLLVFEIFTAEFWERAISPEKLLEYSTSSIRVTVVLVMAWIATMIINRIVPRVREQMVNAMNRGRENGEEFVKRATTVSALFRRTVNTLIWAVAAITALQQAGFDIGPILATAGVAGLAVSFGAQNLVRDIFAGIFMLLEDQIRVGDVARINGTGGLVEEINLRTVRLRSQDGVVHIFPNGTITTLSNLTQEFSYYLWDLGVAYKEDTDHVVEVVKTLAEEMQQEPNWALLILEPLEVLGVDQFGDNAVIIKMRIKTRPIQQWSVGRELNRRIKKRFDELGIEIPFPQRTLHLGQGVAQELAGLKGNGGGVDRALLKEIVQEVLAEMKSGKAPAAEAATKPDTSHEDHASSPDARQMRGRGEHDAPPGGE
jgi:small conductance mechanosensitive channel